MTTQQDVRNIAKQVLESANDLRYLEVCAAFMTERDVRAAVAGEGDTGAARYAEWDPNSTAGAAIKAAEGSSGAPMGTQFDWIIDYFEYYARVSDAPYTAMSDALGEVIDGLAGNAVSFQEDIQGRFDLGDWRGKFARSLHDNVINPLDDVAFNQAHIAKELQAAVAAHRNVVLAARKSMVAIGNQTKASLDAKINPSGDTSTRDALLTVLGAALAVVGVATSIPTGGASVSLVAISLGILGAAKTVVSSAITLNEIAIESGKSEPVVIGGSTASDIVSSMLGEIGKLDEQIRNEEELLKDKLVESIGEVDAWLADTGGRKPRSWHLQSLRPAIADDVPSRNEFDHVDQ